MIARNINHFRSIRRKHFTQETNAQDLALLNVRTTFNAKTTITRQTIATLSLIVHANFHQI